VSVIAYDPAELGRSSASCLRPYGRRYQAAQRIVIPTRLIQRGSGEMMAQVP